MFDICVVKLDIFRLIIEFIEHFIYVIVKPAKSGGTSPFVQLIRAMSLTITRDSTH